MHHMCAVLGTWSLLMSKMDSAKAAHTPVGKQRIEAANIMSKWSITFPKEIYM